MKTPWSTWCRMRYAQLNGYFWLPCPSCGEYFGGHEWKSVNGHLSSIPTTGTDQEPGFHGTGICQVCTLAGVGCVAWAPRQMHLRCGYVPASWPSPCWDEPWVYRWDDQP